MVGIARRLMDSKMGDMIWTAIPVLIALMRQSPPGPGEVNVERVYHQAVDAYRRGDIATAFDEVKELSRDQILNVLDIIRKARTEPVDRRTISLQYRWSQQEVLAAGLLHGDAALAALGSRGNGFDLDLLLTLTALPIADTPAADSSEIPETWTRDWLRATAALLLTRGLQDATNAVLNRARALFPDDGPLQLTRGMFDEYESTGAASALAYRDGPFGWTRPHDARENNLKSAANAFEQALRHMPDSDDARLRLAHVDMALGRGATAIPLLEQARNSQDPTVVYLAELMLGDIRARAQEAGEAEALYRDAIKRSGGAQSAYVALSMLQYSTGQRAEAAATLGTMFGHPRVVDPWWSYLLGAPEHPRADLAALRAWARR